MADTGAPERFESLDSWRGICAVMVAIYHFAFVMNADSIRSAFILNSYLFVDFFFVLSGFVVCHAYRDRLDAPRKVGGFILRRFGRLWPLHAAILFAMMVAIMAINLFGPYPDQLAVHANTGSYSLLALVLNALLLNSMSLYGSAWNGPAWSIGAELYTYILFAAVIVLSGRRLVAASLLLVAGASLALLALAPSYMNSTADYGLVRCVAGFFTGVVAYHLHVRMRARALPFATVAEVAAVAIAGLFVIVAGNGPDKVHALSLLAPAVFGCAILIFAREGGALSRALRVRPLRALGRWSYSIYMVHVPLLVLLAYGVWLYGEAAGITVRREVVVEGYVKHLYDLGHPMATQALLAGFLVVTVALAAFTYARIEDPWRGRLNRLARRYEEGGRRSLALGRLPAEAVPIPVRDR
nr:acyltransferase [Bosea sp. 117]